jgi:hypothetical protein
MLREVVRHLEIIPGEALVLVLEDLLGRSFNPIIAPLARRRTAA